MHWHGRNLKFFSHETPIGIADNQISLNFFRKKHIFEAKSFENCNFSRLRHQSVPQANIFIQILKFSIGKFIPSSKNTKFFARAFALLLPLENYIYRLLGCTPPSQICFWIRHWNYSWLKIFLALCPHLKSWLRHWRGLEKIELIFHTSDIKRLYTLYPIYEWGI